MGGGEEGEVRGGEAKGVGQVKERIKREEDV
jgi:hypothetical protein